MGMSTIYLSEHTHDVLIEYLKKLGHELVFIHSTQLVYDAVSAHPDIYLCKMGAKPSDPVFIGDPKELGVEYPYNIKFNAVCLGDYFIHHLTHTSPQLLQAAKDMGKQLIHVKQGYAKCNTVVVDDNAVITSDVGIIKALASTDIQVLPIQQGFVKLAGFLYGFLGGASGRVGNQIIFNGNLEQHPDWQKICQFIESRNLSVYYSKEYSLEDIGSIIEAKENK